MCKFSRSRVIPRYEWVIGTCSYVWLSSEEDTWSIQLLHSAARRQRSDQCDSLPFVGLEMTLLVFLPAPAGARVISTRRPGHLDRILVERVIVIQRDVDDGSGHLVREIGCGESHGHIIVGREQLADL